MKQVIIAMLIIVFCIVACSTNEGHLFDKTLQKTTNLSTQYVISSWENVSYGVTLNFEYDHKKRLQHINQGEQPLLHFTYLSDSDGYFLGLRKIEQFRPFNDDFCGFEGRYPDTFIVDSVTSNHVSFRRETKRHDGSLACLSHHYITYTFDGDLIKQFTIKYANPIDSEFPTIFNFHHDSLGNLLTITRTDPTMENQTIITVLENEIEAVRPEIFPILGTDLGTFQNYFFPNKYLSNSIPKKIQLGGNNKTQTSEFQFDENGLVISQQVLKNGFLVQYEKEYIPLRK